MNSVDNFENNKINSISLKDFSLKRLNQSFTKHIDL